MLSEEVRGNVYSEVSFGNRVGSRSSRLCICNLSCGFYSLCGRLYSLCGRLSSLCCGLSSLCGGLYSLCGNLGSRCGLLCGIGVGSVIVAAVYGCYGRVVESYVAVKLVTVNQLLFVFILSLCLSGLKCGNTHLFYIEINSRFACSLRLEGYRHKTNLLALLGELIQAKLCAVASDRICQITGIKVDDCVGCSGHYGADCLVIVVCGNVVSFVSRKLVSVVSYNPLAVEQILCTVNEISNGYFVVISSKLFLCEGVSLLGEQVRSSFNCKCIVCAYRFYFCFRISSGIGLFCAYGQSSHTERGKYQHYRKHNA